LQKFRTFSDSAHEATLLDSVDTRSPQG